jgi:hypothetical protein
MSLHEVEMAIRAVPRRVAAAVPIRRCPPGTGSRRPLGSEERAILAFLGVWLIVLAIIIL